MPIASPHETTPPLVQIPPLPPVPKGGEGGFRRGRAGVGVRGGSWVPVVLLQRRLELFRAHDPELLGAGARRAVPRHRRPRLPPRPCRYQLGGRRAALALMCPELNVGWVSTRRCSCRMGRETRSRIRRVCHGGTKREASPDGLQALARQCDHHRPRTTAPSTTDTSRYSVSGSRSTVALGNVTWILAVFLASSRRRCAAAPAHPGLCPHRARHT